MAIVQRARNAGVGRDVRLATFPELEAYRMAQTDLDDPRLRGGPEPDAGGSPLYDPKVRGAVFQIAVILLFAYLLYSLATNTVANLEEQGKSLGFGFFNDTAGFQFLSTLGTWYLDYEPGVSTNFDVFLIGVINTFVIAFLGIIFATIIGFVMGIFRLSSNIVLKGFSTFWVECFRNVPLLLWLFIFYFTVLRTLPGPRDRAMLWGESVGINIKGLYAPYPVLAQGFWLTSVAFLVGILAWVLVSKWASARQAATGKQFPSFWVGLGLLIAIPSVVFLATGAPLSWEYPIYKDTGPMLRRGYAIGVGMTIPPEMIAMLVALTFYTSAFIAEIVRAGILAVDKGQTEAAKALGVRPSPTLNLIVIPQAMRVIVPPLTSQYLNLMKNSSLAVAIAYPDLVSVFMGTAMNQVGKEVEMVFIGMLVYLTFSLLTSAFMNWFNNRTRLVER